MAIDKLSKTATWLYENTPTQLFGVGAGTTHRVCLDESIMNIDKDVETIIVGCVTAVCVFVVRQVVRILWNKFVPKHKVDK